MLGVRKVLCLHGDPGEHPVKDWDTFDLLKHLKTLEFKMELGAALNPYKPIQENMQAKLDAGAEFFQTQPVMSQAAKDNLLALEEKDKILVGVSLSNKMANLPGLGKVDEGFVSNPLKYALELVEFAKQFKGMHVMSHSIKAYKEFVESL